MKRLVKERLLYPVVLCRARAQSEKVCLTFDDGPHPTCTPKVLDILEQAGVRATFFCIGEQMAQYPEIVARACAAGHDVANHSMTHAEFAQLDASMIASEFDQVAAVCGLDGRPLLTTSYVRPPKGVIGHRVLVHAIRTGRRVVLWNSDPEDFRASDASEILNFFERKPVQAGDVVLLHDRVEATVEALPTIIERIKTSGLQAVTISEVFGRRPIYSNKLAIAGNAN